MTNFVNACESLARKEQKRRHNKVALNISCVYGITGACQQHTLERVMDEKQKTKLFWDFDFQTDETSEHRRLDRVTFKQDKQLCQIIDVAVLGGQYMKMEEREKIDKYGELRTEIAKMQQLRKSKRLSLLLSEIKFNNS